MGHRSPCARTWRARLHHPDAYSQPHALGGRIGGYGHGELGPQVHLRDDVSGLPARVEGQHAVHGLPRDPVGSGEISSRATEPSWRPAWRYTPLHADPSKLSKDTAKVLAQAVAPMLELDTRDTEKRLNRRNRQDVRLAKNLVPWPTQRHQGQSGGALRGSPVLRGALFSRNEYRRFYPAGPDAAPLLGLGQASTGREGLSAL